MTYTDRDLEISRHANAYLVGWLLGDLPDDELEHHIERLDSIQGLYDGVDGVVARATDFVREQLAERRARSLNAELGKLRAGSATPVFPVSSHEDAEPVSSTRPS